MDEHTVTLYMKGHCIETEAKRELRRITELLISTDDESVIKIAAASLELLREFLETADFNSLRSSDERLAGIRPGCCKIGYDSAGRPGVLHIE